MVIWRGETDDASFSAESAAFGYEVEGWGRDVGVWGEGEQYSQLVVEVLWGNYQGLEDYIFTNILVSVRAY